MTPGKPAAVSAWASSACASSWRRPTATTASCRQSRAASGGYFLIASRTCCATVAKSRSSAVAVRASNSASSGSRLRVRSVAERPLAQREPPVKSQLPLYLVELPFGPAPVAGPSDCFVRCNVSPPGGSDRQQSLPSSRSRASGPFRRWRQSSVSALRHSRLRHGLGCGRRGRCGPHLLESSRQKLGSKVF